jgi:hypothetical protein
MPFIRKRRIWWEPVAEATSYVVYVSKDGEVFEPARFSWGNTPGIISRPVIGKTDLVIPDEWPEFPIQPGIYHIAITSRDDVENQSNPFLLSGHFKLVAPPSPSRSGIESLPLGYPGPVSPTHSATSQGKAIIQGGIEEVKNNKEVLDAYLGDK